MNENQTALGEFIHNTMFTVGGTAAYEPLPNLQAPFPFFGGKRRAAPTIWDALGDPGGYLEPFCGSAAVLLARPRFTGRRVETINDADGWLINAWRSIQLSPTQVAHHTHGPVAEVDYHARLAWLQERRSPDLVAWLEGDPEHHDPKAAGWWLYVMACGIGDPWGPGPWRIVDGHLRDTRALPHLGDAGRGVNRELPHLGNAGRGVNRELPHLGNAGRDRLTAYMHSLATRLTTVRITCGTWQRILKPSVICATAHNSHIGILLDPPYSISGDLYATTNNTDAQQIADETREWCAENSANYRIVLCGFNNDHDELLHHGWTKEAGRAGGGAGYNTDPRAGRRERLWLSPNACNPNTHSTSRNSMGRYRTPPNQGFAKSWRGTLTHHDLAVLATFFGFPTVDQFKDFVRHQDDRAQWRRTA